ncbi:EGF-like domain-containing protein 2 [Haliotis cracherodii]|uniref:EGF-like domain-containing protein 2 n=1 Tax=Haliotis cracherodii TaxID=6455 RepID=UPI0039E8148C
MKSSLFIALLVATCLEVCRAQTGSVFNCKNPGNDCINGGVCDYTNGICQCITGFEGESCHITSANKCTSLNCGVNGVCERRSGLDQCVCNAGYSGGACENAPMNCQCLSDRMIVSMTPPGDFSNGEGYVENFGAQSECNTVPTGRGNTHDITLNYFTSRCGSVTRRDLTSGYAYTRYFIYRYSRIIRTGTDIRFQCNCIFDPSNNVLYASFGNINPNDLGNLIFQNTTNYISPITYTMTNNVGQAITSASALKIGDEVVLTFITDGGYCAVFDRLVATNPSTAEEAVLLDSGCVTALGKSVVKPDPIYNSDLSQWTISLYAFLFDNSNALRLAIFYRSSTDRTQCSLPTCPASGRKRRDTAEAAKENDGVINQTIYINTPYEQSGFTDREDKECTMSSSVMIGLIALAAIICVLLVVCFIFGLRMLMARNKNKTVN